MVNMSSNFSPCWSIKTRVDIYTTSSASPQTISHHVLKQNVTNFLIYNSRLNTQTQSKPAYIDNVLPLIALRLRQLIVYYPNIITAAQTVATKSQSWRSCTQKKKKQKEKKRKKRNRTPQETIGQLPQGDETSIRATWLKQLAIYSTFSPSIFFFTPFFCFHPGLR